MSLFFPNIGFLKVNSKNSVEKLIFGVFVNGKTQFFSFYWIRIFFQKCITCWDFSCKCRRMVYKNSYISYISFSVLSIFGVALFYKCVDELNIQAQKSKGRKKSIFSMVQATFLEYQHVILEIKKKSNPMKWNSVDGYLNDTLQVFSICSIHWKKSWRKNELFCSILPSFMIDSLLKEYSFMYILKANSNYQLRQ